MEQPYIDYNAVSADITKKCYQLLQNVNEYTVSDSFDAAKEIVEIAIENYSFQVSKHWMENNSDAVLSRKIKFTDVNDGYVILLKKRIEINPFKVVLPECPINITESYEEYVSKLNKKALAVGAVGTFTLCTAYCLTASHSASNTTPENGLYIFGNPIAAIAAEIIGISAIYAVVQYKKNNKRKEIDSQNCDLEKALNNFKQKVITALTVSAEEYIKDAETYSNNLLASF